MNNWQNRPNEQSVQALNNDELDEVAGGVIGPFRPAEGKPLAGTPESILEATRQNERSAGNE